jgi:ABC-type multidrug transport system permease subunit
MSLSSILTLSKIYSKWFFRRPLTYMFITIFMPLSIITPLLILSAHVSWPRVIIGALLFSVIGGGVSDVTLNVSYDRHMGRIVFITTRPVKSMEYMLGIMLGGASYTFVSAAIILAAGEVILHFAITPLQLLAMIPIILLTWFISSNVGFILSLYGPKDYRLAGTLSDFLLFAVTFIAPVYYSIYELPQILRPFSQLLYTTDMALLANWIVDFSALPNSLFDILFPITFGIALFFISSKKLKWIKM